MVEVRSMAGILNNTYLNALLGYPENIASYITRGEQEAGETDFDFNLSDEKAEDIRSDMVSKGILHPSQ